MQHTKYPIVFFAFLAVTACIEPIEFEAGNEPRRIVIDGMITNISYNERQELPEFPARFMVRVQYTGPVNNERNEPIPDANVVLLDDQGSSWEYEWNEELTHFVLYDDEFGAEEERSYRIRVTLPDGEIYESEPQQMRVANTLSGVTPELKTRIMEEDIGGQVAFKEQKGVSLYANVPEPDSDESYYLRYRVTPSWVYVAPAAREDSPLKTCYVTNIYYFKKIITRLERSGNTPLELFFLETVNNLRLKYDFTVNVTQLSLDPHGYEFWDQLALQQESGGGIFDPPPFELTTNLLNVNDPEEKVSGFFYVAHESSVRWYINESELPYSLGQYVDPCSTPPLTEDCYNCLKYRGGSSSNTNIRPEWWRQY